MPYLKYILKNKSFKIRSLTSLCAIHVIALFLKNWFKLNKWFFDFFFRKHLPLQARPQMSLWIVRGIWFLAPLVDFRNWKKFQFYVCMYIALEWFIWTAEMYILLLACTNIGSTCIPSFNRFNVSKYFLFC